MYDTISGKKFKRLNIVTAKQGNTVLSPLQYEWSMTKELFESWFEKFFLPELAENSVLVMDNASFHRKKRLHEFAQNHQMILIFLPPYSPELNPIEKEWANLKQCLHLIFAYFST